VIGLVGLGNSGYGKDAKPKLNTFGAMATVHWSSAGCHTSLGKISIFYLVHKPTIDVLHIIIMT